jgi:hypothetical protein
LEAEACLEELREAAKKLPSDATFLLDRCGHQMRVQQVLHRRSITSLAPTKRKLVSRINCQSGMCPRLSRIAIVALSAGYSYFVNSRSLQFVLLAILRTRTKIESELSHKGVWTSVVPGGPKRDNLAYQVCYRIKESL